MSRHSDTVRSIALGVLLAISLFLGISGATGLAGDVISHRLSLEDYRVYMGMCAPGMAGLAVLVLRRE